MTEELSPTSGLQMRAERLSGTTCQQVSAEEAVRLIRSGEQVVWLDILVSDYQAAYRLLRDELGYHELAVEDALSDHERPSLQVFERTTFVPITCMELAGGELQLSEIGVFLEETSIVTVTHKRHALVDHWFSRWQAHPTRIAEHPAHLLYVLLDSAVDNYFPVLDEIEDLTEELTEEVLAGKQDSLTQVIALKRKLLKIRRAISPLRDMMNSLLRRDLDVIPESARPYFQDILDHVLRVAELAETQREALTGLMDVHLSSVSYNLNQVMKKMTVISTLLMTMALIAGIYGMNFDRMPELHWMYGYPFALGLMVVSAGVIWVIFRYIRWV